ncbi:hypothetical protein [Candidatus Skiveiella danica]|uniref:hypothetical protein n=1 Tax=Candidatus Skiveiella danica TaxID=3386177 RepID=UPI001D647BCE|nr:hypothetical protein [Betaproteobacteria bacterium]
MPDLDYWRANGHPAAFHHEVVPPQQLLDRGGVAMLDTLLGEVLFAGVSLAHGEEDENLFQMTDETGRTVSLLQANCADTLSSIESVTSGISNRCRPASKKKPQRMVSHERRRP